MRLNKPFITFTFTLFSLSLFSQMDKDFFPLSREYKPWGFTISPELNKQFAFSNFSEVVTFSDTSSYDYNLEGSSKIGIGGEIGAFYALKQPKLFHFVEANLGYRRLNSTTKHNGILNVVDTLTNFSSENEYNQQLVHFSLRATHVLQLKRYSMLMNSIGVNLNYRLSESIERSSNYPAIEESFTSSPSVQIHYQIGFGYRINKYIILAPSLETSLLTLHPFESVKTGFNYFNQDYQPFYLKLRIFIFQKDPVNCNAPTYKGPAAI